MSDSETVRSALCDSLDSFLSRCGSPSPYHLLAYMPLSVQPAMQEGMVEAECSSEAQPLKFTDSADVGSPADLRLVVEPSRE